MNVFIYIIACSFRLSTNFKKMLNCFQKLRYSIPFFHAIRRAAPCRTLENIAWLPKNVYNKEYVQTSAIIMLR